MRLVIDGVFFQMASTGISRVWSSVLPYLARNHDLEIILLDRGNAPSIEGIRNVPFPSYSIWSSVADSCLLDEFCREFKADIFSSTYYTTPISVPSVLLVHDMIPEIFEFNMRDRVWQEKHTAISFASYFACVSENTQSDLLRFYPHIERERVTVAYCGIDRSLFGPRAAKDIYNFRKRFDIQKPYYLLVGSREQHRGYKNAFLMFAAAQSFDEFEFEIVCVGGESTIDCSALRSLPSCISARRIELDDANLACAYSGAEALVYPSLYEGFGLPVIEAMACGCPVITTRHGSLAEVSGDAAIFISGHNAKELGRALREIRKKAVREDLIERGLRHAAQFNWEFMAQSLYGQFQKAYDVRDCASTREFLIEWKRLREIQWHVDCGA